MHEEQGIGYAVKLDIFEGPLDLLLHLIKKNEIDIYNIPIATITEQYLNYLKIIKSLNLDLAGEYLVMASTLIHIKSKMLLPAPEDLPEEEKEEDPREELVRQLLEYKLFKEAALQLERQPLLDRDVFTRCAAVIDEMDKSNDDDVVLIEVSVFDLIDAFHRLVSKTGQKELIEIDLEKMSIADIINEIMDRLSREKSLTFEEMLGEKKDRRRIIYTFLAILELIKMKMIKAYQTAVFGTIRIFPAVES